MYTVVPINGGEYDPSTPGSEGNLNIQYTETIAYPTPHVYYITGRSTPQIDDQYVNWLKYILELKSILQTISTLYGGYEYFVPPGYAKTICDQFAQLGAHGVSLLFGSGDWGVREELCLVRDSSGNTHVHFLPIFPATCPYVTSVGGTTGGAMKEPENPEVVAGLSGGGFSNYFPRPDYY
ncbi:peptidase S8/S53 domain-containing protein [Lactarius quietus]|nr:peptidase S8/S53 domain-containing protein [Lactarius quietus]